MNMIAEHITPVMKLRDHQRKAIELLRQSILAGKRMPILHAPCSFGKTIVAAELSNLTICKGGKVLFLTHRRLLALQTQEKFERYGLYASILMAGEQTDWEAPVIIATVQTMSRRIQLNDKFVHPADLVIIDEAHLLMGEMTKDILGRYEGKVVVGLTGSPARGNGSGLGSIYDDIVSSIGIDELTESGYLKPIRYFTLDVPDLKGVKTVNGDFEQGALEKKMNKVKLVGDIVGTWIEKAEGRQTIVFATGVKHSISLCNQFSAMGVSAYHLDAKSPHDERVDVLGRFKSGEINVLLNVGLFTEGFDCDCVSCVVVARPTKSLPLWIQMAGRGQRIFDGDENCILLDHGGNFERLGSLSDNINWPLSEDEEVEKAEPKEKEKKPSVCRSCREVFIGESKCPRCGTELKTFGREVETADGELKEVGKSKKKTYSMAEKRIYYGMMLKFVADKGWSPGAAAHRYRDKFGVWPKLGNVAPIEPDAGFLSYQKHLAIKYAKSKKRIR